MEIATPLLLALVGGLIISGAQHLLLGWSGRSFVVIALAYAAIIWIGLVGPITIG